MAPQTQKALFALTPVNGALEVRDREVPKPGPGQLLVKIHATSLNPVDWFIHRVTPNIPPFPQPEDFPVILGCDSAGTVEEIGEGVTGFAKGDRVVHAGAFGNDFRTFQQYCIANADFTSKFPENVSFEQAATLPLCLETAVAGLYGKRESEGAPDYDAPWVEGGRGKYKEPIVIFGGASTVGYFAIQLAKLSGFDPIVTTASLKNKDFCTSAGATHVVDRLSATTVADIAAILNGKELMLVYDAVTDTETVTAALDLLAPGGLLLRHPRPPQIPLPKPEGKYEHIIWGSLSTPTAKRLGLSLAPKLGEMLKNGDLKPMAIDVLPNGLDGIADGLERLFSKAVSAKKLIARPIDS